MDEAKPKATVRCTRKRESRRDATSHASPQPRTAQATAQHGTSQDEMLRGASLKRAAPAPPQKMFKRYYPTARHTDAHTDHNFDRPGLLRG